MFYQDNEKKKKHEPDCPVEIEKMILHNRILVFRAINYRCCYQNHLSPKMLSFKKSVNNYISSIIIVLFVLMFE